MRNTTQYQLAGPKTFRRGSRKLLGEKNKRNMGWGTNLQNVEKSLRSIYISDGLTKDLETKGKCKYWLETGDMSVFTQEELDTLRVMAQVDQSGAEALIVAYECEAGNFRQLFIHNVKPHVYMALKLFKEVWPKKMGERGGIKLDIDLLDNTPIAELKFNPQWKELDALIKDSDNWSLSERYYYLAKQTVHSANYDIQAPTFRLNILDKSGGKIVISDSDSKKFLIVYRGEFPEIPERNRKIQRIIHESGILYNLHGHPYIITSENLTESTYKEYYAWSAQSTVGEITRIAFTNLQYFIWETGKRWDVLQDNHDSYLAQFPLFDAKDAGKKMQEFMNIELTSPADGTKFRMKSECQYGFNWSPYDKNNPEKNPLGLRELSWMK